MDSGGELTIKQLSPDVHEYSFGNNPNTAFTFTRVNDDTFVYAPTETSSERISGKKGIVAINELVALLPKLNLWNGEEHEYPSDIDLSECGTSIAPISNRQIWVIGSIPFFRRYNDDWNPCVMYAKKFGSGLSWNPLSHEKLGALLEFVKSKDPTTITEGELVKTFNL